MKDMPNGGDAILPAPLPTRANNGAATIKPSDMDRFCIQYRQHILNNTPIDPSAPILETTTHIAPTGIFRANEPRYWKQKVERFTQFTAAQSHVLTQQAQVQMQEQVAQQASHSREQLLQLQENTEQSCQQDVSMLLNDLIITPENFDAVGHPYTAKEIAEAWFQLVGRTSAQVIDRTRVISGVSLTAMRLIMQHQAEFIDGVVMNDLPDGFFVVERDIPSTEIKILDNPISKDLHPPQVTQQGTTRVLYYAEGKRNKQRTPLTLQLPKLIPAAGTPYAGIPNITQICPNLQPDRYGSSDHFFPGHSVRAFPEQLTFHCLIPEGVKGYSAEEAAALFELLITQEDAAYPHPDNTLNAFTFFLNLHLDRGYLSFNVKYIITIGKTKHRLFETACQRFRRGMTSLLMLGGVAWLDQFMTQMAFLAKQGLLEHFYDHLCHGGNLTDYISPESQAAFQKIAQYSPNERTWWLELTAQHQGPKDFLVLFHAFEAFLTQLHDLGKKYGEPLSLPKLPPQAPHQSQHMKIRLGRIMTILRSALDPHEQMQYISDLDFSSTGAILAPGYIRTAQSAYTAGEKKPQPQTLSFPDHIQLEYWHSGTDLAASHRIALGDLAKPSEQCVRSAQRDNEIKPKETYIAQKTSTPCEHDTECLASDPFYDPKGFLYDAYGFKTFSQRYKTLPGEPLPESICIELSYQDNPLQYVNNPSYRDINYHFNYGSLNSYYICSHIISLRINNHKERYDGSTAFQYNIRWNTSYVGYGWLISKIPSVDSPWRSLRTPDTESTSSNAIAYAQINLEPRLTPTYRQNNAAIVKVRDIEYLNAIFYLPELQQDIPQLLKYFFRFVSQQAYALPIAHYERMAHTLTTRLDKYHEYIPKILFLIAVYTTGKSFQAINDKSQVVPAIEKLCHDILQSVKSPVDRTVINTALETISYKTCPWWNTAISHADRPPTLLEALYAYYHAYQVLQRQVRYTNQCDISVIKSHRCRLYGDDSYRRSRAFEDRLRLIATTYDVDHAFKALQCHGLKPPIPIKKNGEYDDVTWNTYYDESRTLSCFDALSAEQVTNDRLYFKDCSPPSPERRKEHNFIYYLVAIGIFSSRDEVIDFIDTILAIDKPLRKMIYPVFETLNLEQSTLPTGSEMTAAIQAVQSFSQQHFTVTVGDAAFQAESNITSADIERIIGNALPGLCFNNEKFDHALDSLITYLDSMKININEVYKDLKQKLPEQVQEALAELPGPAKSFLPEKLREHPVETTLAFIEAIFPEDRRARIVLAQKALYNKKISFSSCLESGIVPMITEMQALIKSVPSAIRKTMGSVLLSVIVQKLMTHYFLPQLNQQINAGIALFRAALLQDIQQLHTPDREKLTQIITRQLGDFDFSKMPAEAFSAYLTKYQAYRALFEAFANVGEQNRRLKQASPHKLADLTQTYLAYPARFQPGDYAEIIQAYANENIALPIAELITHIAQYPHVEKEILLTFQQHAPYYTGEQLKQLLDLWVNQHSPENREAFNQVLNALDTLGRDYPDAFALIIAQCQTCQTADTLSQLAAFLNKLNPLSNMGPMLSRAYRLDLGTQTFAELHLKTQSTHPEKLKAILRIIDGSVMQSISSTDRDIKHISPLLGILLGIDDLESLTKLAALYLMPPAPGAVSLLAQFEAGKTCSEIADDADLDPLGIRTGNWQEKHYCTDYLAQVVWQTRDLATNDGLSNDEITSLYHDCLAINHLGQRHKLHDQSREHLIQKATELMQAYRDMGGDLTQKHASLLILLAYAREIMFRTYEGKFPYLEQIYVVLLTQRLSGNVMLQIDTGQGKSVISALLCFFEQINGRIVDNLTANDELASRDPKGFACFFKALGLASVNLRPESDAADYHENHIHYTTQSASSLFRAKTHHASEALPNGKRAGIFDECDKPLLDEQTLNNLSRPDFSLSSDPYHNPYAWIYRHLIHFTRSAEFTHASTRADDVRTARRYLMNQCGLTNAQKKQLDQLPDTTLDRMLDANCKAKFLEKDKVYFIKRNQERQVYNKTQKHSEIVIVSGDFPAPGTAWQGGIDNVVKARENEANEQEDVRNGKPARPDPCRIDNDLVVIASESPRDVVRPYCDTAAGNRGIFISGTPASPAEAQEIQSQYGIEHCLVVPPRIPSKRVELPPQFTSAKTKAVCPGLTRHQSAVLRALSQWHKKTDGGGPVVLMVNGMQQAKAYFSALTGGDAFDAQPALSPIIRKALPRLTDMQVQVVDATKTDDFDAITDRAAAQNMLTIATGVFERGVDIRPTEYEPGLLVIPTYPIPYRQYRQFVGRTARNGAPGTVMPLYDAAIYGIENLPYLEQCNTIQSLARQQERDAANGRYYRQAMGDIRHVVLQNRDVLLSAALLKMITDSDKNALENASIDLLRQLDDAWEEEITQMAPDIAIYANPNGQGGYDNAHLDNALTQYKSTAKDILADFGKQVQAISGIAEQKTLDQAYIALDEIKPYQPLSTPASNEIPAVNNRITGALDYDAMESESTILGELQGQEPLSAAIKRSEKNNDFAVLLALHQTATQTYDSKLAKKTAILEKLSNVLTDKALHLDALSRIYDAIRTGSHATFDQTKLQTIVCALKVERHGIRGKLNLLGKTRSWQHALHNLKIAMADIACHEGIKDTQRQEVETRLAQHHGRAPVHIGATNSLAWYRKEMAENSNSGTLDLQPIHDVVY